MLLKQLQKRNIIKTAETAFAQIAKMRYDVEMKGDGINEILKFGIGFSRKKVCVRTT